MKFATMEGGEWNRDFDADLREAEYWESQDGTTEQVPALTQPLQPAVAVGGPPISLPSSMPVIGAIPDMAEEYVSEWHDRICSLLDQDDEYPPFEIPSPHENINVDSMSGKSILGSGRSFSPVSSRWEQQEPSDKPDSLSLTTNMTPLWLSIQSSSDVLAFAFHHAVSLLAEARWKLSLSNSPLLPLASALNTLLQCSLCFNKTQ